MQVPSIYDGMDFDVYLKDPAPNPSLSSSTARELLTTAPARVRLETRRISPNYVEKSKKQFDIGSAAHDQLIGGGKDLEIIHEDSYRKKAAQEQRDYAIAAGKTPILIADYERVTEMSETAAQQMEQNDVLNQWDKCHPAKEGAEDLKEASIFWFEGGVYCRCRPDILKKNASGSSALLVHYKTTAIKINHAGLPRYASNLGWDVLAAHYAAGVKALYGYEPFQLFAIQEIEPPFLMYFGTLHPHFMAVGEMRRQRAIELWCQCLTNDHWPGHPSDAQTIDLPPWHENNAIAEKDYENARKQVDKDILKLGIRMQDPEWIGD